MTDRLIVTLYLLNGFHKEFVEIKEYANTDKPLIVEFEGKKFKYQNNPVAYLPVWNEYENRLGFVDEIGEPIYLEVDNG